MAVHTPNILVAGAGPAGASIARLLALRGRRVTLVDWAAHRVDRLEVIAPAATPVLAALGMAHLLHDPALTRPCLGIRRRWGRGNTETDDFLRRPGGSGFVIDRAAFDAALRAAAMEAGVTIISGRVTAARPNGDVMAVTVATKAHELVLRANLAVDATGRPGVLARRLGVRKLMRDSLIAERRRLAPAHASCHDAAWLTVAGRAHAWSYRICGPDGRRERWMIYRPESRAHYDARLRDQPARQRVDATVQRADASSACLSRAAGSRWIAIGDAAACFDPVTSQGLANALSTALVAAGAILSPRGLDDEACRVYSDAVAATWKYSEAGRQRVYAAAHL